jgi:hypothetical protein
VRQPRVAAPLTHENLSVYLLYGSDAVADAKVLSLQEALEREVAVVHETSDVNMLSVENLSPEYELFIQSGDIVKGGKQDRMAATDMLLPPKSGVIPLPAHCVERGRWTNRGGENAERFVRCDNFAAGRDVKYANASGQQGAVWQSVSENQGKLNKALKANVNCPTSPTSFQLTLEAPVVQAKVAEYEAALKAAGADREGVVGVVFVVNGQVTGAEVYASNALFRKAWPKLLNSAAVEAVAELTDKPAAAAPSVREVEHFLASGATPANGVGAPGVDGDPARNPTEEAGNIAVRRVQIVERSSRSGGASNADLEDAIRTAREIGARNGGVQPTDGAADSTIMGGRGRSAPNPALAQNPPIVVAAAEPVIGLQAGNIRARGNVTAIPIQGLDNVAVREPAPVSSNGNRLNSSRTENSSTLMVESRDPTRQNAVIHRSYLKK